MLSINERVCESSGENEKGENVGAYVDNRVSKVDARGEICKHRISVVARTAR